MSEHRPQRARASVVPLPAAGERLALLRALPTGRSLLIGFAIVACAVGLYVLARETPMFAVQRIEIAGAPPDVAAHVRAALGPLEGKSLLELDDAAVNRALAPLTDVSAARYDRDFPHTLRIYVRAEQPVAVARRGHDAWLVSASARVISTVPLGTHRSMPRVWLTGSGDPEPGTSLGDHPAFRAVRALARARRAGFDRRVLFVRAGPHELTFLLASGFELRLGDLRAIPLKLAVATQIIPSLQEDSPYDYLDVSVPGRPVAGERTLNPKVEP